jgi:protein tyrosine phosphatase (PTP) superfamily phosphohydrolase (DUF442 family)
VTIEKIKNLVQVSERIATAGQPSAEQLQAVAAEGFAAVVNLGLLDPRYCLPDERATVLAAGMAYCHIPVEFGSPQLSQLEAFFAVMDSNADRKVFVHCAANYRVSCFLAMYGRARWNWSEAQANEYIGATWEPDQVWRDFMAAAAARLLPVPAMAA